MPDFFGYMNRILNLQANTNLMNQEAAGQQILAQEREMNVQLQRQQLQDEAAYRQQLASMLKGGQPQQVVNGEVQEVGDPLINTLSRQVTRDQQSAQTARKVADAMSTTVSPTFHKQLEDEADKKERVALATESAYRLAQSDLAKHLGSIAGSALDAHDDEGLRQALTQLSALDPQRVKTMDLDRDANNIPKWGDRSERAMRMLRDQGMDAAQQATMAKQIADEKARQDQLRIENQRENRMADAATAQAAATRALTGERLARTAQIEAKTKRLDSVASLPATSDMRNVARSSISAMDEFKDAKFDNTIDAFAGDVADRANKIRADANKEGDDIGLDEARQQAIAQLKGNVRKTKVDTGWFSSEERYTYGRGGGETGKPVEGPPQTKVTTKSEYDALPSGASFVDSEGKKWTKP